MNIDRIIEILENFGFEAKADVVKGKEAFVVGRPNGAAAAVIYFEYIDSSLDSDYEIAAAIIEKVEEGLDKLPDVDKISNDFKDIDFLSDNLFIALCPAGKMESRNVVCREFNDEIDMYVRIYIKDLDDGDTAATTAVTEDLLEIMKISENKLFELATANTIMNAEVTHFLGILPVIGSKLNMFGASSLIDEGLLAELAEKYDGKIAIIPSSIHELFCFPFDSEDMLDALVEAHKATIDEDDDEFLSHSCYIYDLNEGLYKWSAS